MALTQSAWTETLSSSNIYTALCTVISTTGENDAYTLKTSTDLDPKKPWTLFYSASATPDAEALPFEIYAGYSASFAITGDAGTIGATDGGKVMQLLDDVVLAVSPLKYVFDIDPDLAITPVVTAAAVASGFKVKVPVAPYYAFNLNGGSTLAAVTHTFIIIQDQS